MKKYHSALTVVAATVGVLFVTGGALGATHYVISSMHQIKPSVRSQLRGNQGPRGFQGPAGLTGATGATGATGIAGITTVTSPELTLAPGQDSPIGSLVAQCPAGSTVIGTGFDDGGVTQVGFVEKFGTFAGGFMWNDTGITVTGLSVQAICASGSGVTDRALGVRAARDRRAAYLQRYNAAKAALSN
jgi:hypothetical protein